MRKWFALALMLLFANCAFAMSKLVWDVPGAPDAPTAQGYIYKYYPDGASTGIQITGAICTGTTTVTCSAPFPMAPNGVPWVNGSHTLVMTGADLTGPDSPQSTVLPFKIVGVGNPRVQ